MKTNHITTRIYTLLSAAIKEAAGHSIAFDISHDESGALVTVKNGEWEIETDGDYWHANFKSKEGRISGILKIDADDCTDVSKVARAFVCMVSL